MKGLSSFIIAVLGGVFGGVVYYIVRYASDSDLQHGGSFITNDTQLSWLILCVLISAFIFHTITPAIIKHLKEIRKGIGRDLESTPAHRVVSGAVGMIFGLLVALLISKIYAPVLTRGWYALLTIAVYIVCGFVGYSVAVSKDRELEHGLSAGFFSGKGRSRTGRAPKIIDTSVIIDGRISDIMKAGFIEGQVIVPEFVLVELQHLADSSDSLKRARGRRGLEILDDLQKDFDIDIYSTEKMKNVQEIPEVDGKLIKLAQNLKGRLLTTDYNLNKVATINDVKVMNINDLANAIKPVVIPGEKIRINVVKQGKNPEQGIGFLDDGTMVVIEDGRDAIGDTVEITVTSMIQTSAGKMIFGRQHAQTQMNT